MNKKLPLTLGLLAALTTAVQAEEPLQAPDVNFYLEAQVNRTDYDVFSLTQSNGLSLRGGMWLNELDTGGQSRLGLDATLLQMGKDSDNIRFERAPSPSDGSGTTRVQVDQERDLRINGLALGTTWDTGNHVHLRAGGFLYNFKASSQRQRILIDDNNNTRQTVNDPRQSESESGIAPYLGVGVSLPLLDQLSLVADYQHYLIESEHTGSLSLGLRYSD